MAEQQCPKCSAECWRDEVDIGVGVQYGPWRCSECGWGERDDEPVVEEACSHEWEWITTPSSPSGPAEHFKVCKLCGMEYPGSNA